VFAAAETPDWLLAAGSLTLRLVEIRRAAIASRA